jgi:hypothetical protein
MFPRAITRAGLVAGALFLASQPTAARAATVDWLVGPLVIVGGLQVAEVIVGDGGTAALVGVQVLTSVQIPRLVSEPAPPAPTPPPFPLTVAYDSLNSPAPLAPRTGLNVGVAGPGGVVLVQAKVRATASVTAAQLRRIPVTLVIFDTNNGDTVATAQGVVQ